MRAKNRQRKRSGNATALTGPTTPLPWSSPWFYLTLAFGIALAIFPIASEDIGWHLKTGQWMLEHHALARHNLFLHTLPESAPWNDVQWCFQIVIALAHAIGGWNALIALRAVWVCLFICALWGWLRERGFAQTPIAVAAGIVILSSRSRFEVRPELFTFTLMTLQFWIYDRSVRRGRLEVAPLLLTQFVWANWHSSCILGPIVSGVFVLTQTPTVRKVFPRAIARPTLSMAPLILALAAMIGVTLVNPFGWQTPLYAITQGRKSYISEFQPATIALFLGIRGAAIILGGLGWRGLWRQNGPFFALLVTCFFAQTLRMNRFFPYFAIAIVPALAEAVSLLAGWVGVVRVRTLRIACGCAASIAAGALVARGIHDDHYTPLKLGFDDSTFPAAAADFVIRENLQGNMFNEFNDGGYLIWRLAPQRKVFMYGESSLNAPVADWFYGSSRSQLDFQHMCDQFHVTYAILDNATAEFLPVGELPISRIIHRYLKDWKLVCWDDAGTVFVKQSAQYKSLIERFACIVSPDDIPDDNNPAPDLSAIERFSKDNILWPRAEKELERVITESPHHYRAALALGIARDFRGDTTGELVAYHMAEQLNPDGFFLLQCMASWHLRHGDPLEAVRYQERAIEKGAKTASAYCDLAEALDKAGRKDNARKAADKALSLDPNSNAALELRAKLQ